MPRKQHNIHYIYKTTCNVTGRYYIGMHSTANLDDGYLGSGKRLRGSIRKYSKENHTREILEYCNNREELVVKEQELITNEHLNDDLCMNLMSGGTGGFVSVEVQRHRSECAIKARLLKEKNNPLWAKEYYIKRGVEIKKASKEGRLPNIVNNYSWRGKKHKDETKKLISKKNSGTGIGVENSQFGSFWITNGEHNKKIKNISNIPDGWYKGRKLNYGKHCKR